MVYKILIHTLQNVVLKIYNIALKQFRKYQSQNHSNNPKHPQVSWKDPDEHPRWNKNKSKCKKFEKYTNRNSFIMYCKI